jgi:hypothetical protein
MPLSNDDSNFLGWYRVRHSQESTSAI